MSTQNANTSPEVTEKKHKSPLSLHSQGSNLEKAGQAAAYGGTSDLNKVEAPLTFKTYMMCCFAAIGGIFYGYDTGYISGVMGMDYFITHFAHKDKAALTAAKKAKEFVLSTSSKSLITCMLSAGTFFGSLAAGDFADWWGRRNVIIAGCLVFSVGVAVQTASTTIAVITVGRGIAGIGVGFVSAIIILYMSEIAPRKVRGAIVSGYQFCITIGLMVASCVDYGTENRTDASSYRIPIGLQFVWAFVLGAGLCFLPESPRYYVKKGNIDKAAIALSKVRGQPVDSEYIKDELSEIIANDEIEAASMPSGGYWASWKACFQGSLRNPASNLRRTILGTSLQMMQQLTGINFIFYFGTTFFQQLGTIHNEFLITIITTIVNVFSTPVSFYTIEKFGRRPLLIWGGLGMTICEFIVAIAGVVDGENQSTVKAMIAFICIYIFFFASTWGPGAWVIIGENFPLAIRSRGVALSTASNWFWNCIIAVITPYMVDADYGNLGARVFFLWGSLCATCFVYAYLVIPETKGLTLEQVDQMVQETTPRTSSKWRPHETFASQLGIAEDQTKPGVSHEESPSPSSEDDVAQMA